VKAPPQYEGFIENTHMLRIGVRDMHGIVINWEDHYRRNPTDEGLANVDTRLHIEASFVEVSLYHDATDPRHPDESKPWQSKILWAGLERRDKTVVSTPFAFMPPGGETWPAPYEKFNSVKWQGFIIGRRGAHEEKYGSLTRGCIVLMIVDEGSGVAERLGLATFYNTIELEDVPTRRRSILLG
jgi:hypothetical protein